MFTFKRLSSSKLKFAKTGKKKGSATMALSVDLLTAYMN